VNEKQWLTSTDAGAMLDFLDGEAGDRKLRLFVCACFRGLLQGMDRDLVHVLRLVEMVAVGRAPLGHLLRDSDDFESLADPFRYAQHCAEWAVPRGARKAKACVQPHLLRCLFGNPWRPLLPCTFPAHVTGLARSICDAFPAVSPEYAILGDGLEELGETEAAAHCRQELHSEGCHVLDWITGRS
jgi:hypothetical protein